MTNWGRDDMIPDLTPDADAINIVVYYRLASRTVTDEANVTIEHSLVAGGAPEVTGQYQITMEGEDKDVSTLQYQTCFPTVEFLLSL